MSNTVLEYLYQGGTEAESWAQVSMKKSLLLAKSGHWVIASHRQIRVGAQP